MAELSRRSVLASAAGAVVGATAPLAPGDRKFEGAVFTDRRLTVARSNAARFDWAGQRVSELRTAIQPWLRLSLRELWELVPGPHLGRTIDVVMTRDPVARTTRRKGCPACGADRGYEVHPDVSRYAAFCSACRERFPRNDFARYLSAARGRDGFFDPQIADRSLLRPDPGITGASTAVAVDDGLGWRDGEGFTYRFVAFAIDKLWGALIYGARDLAECWALTGDPDCARRAAVILDRVADCYPQMDWAPYAKLGWYHSDGDSGRGKIWGRIWECVLVTAMARAYDQTLAFAGADEELHAFLAEQSSLHALPGPKGSAAAYRDCVETRVLRTGLQAISDEQIRGNHGVHQLSAAWCAIALQSGAETEQWLDWIFSENGLEVPQVILGHMDRDGLGDEGAPGYAWGWGLAFHDLAELVHRYGKYDRWRLERDFPPFRRSYTAPGRMSMLDGRVPTLGDHGACMERAPAPQDRAHLFGGFRLTSDPEIAAELQRIQPDLDVCRDPFDEAPDAWPDRIRRASKQALPTSPGGSILPGFGLATLELDGPGGGTAVWIAFGRNRGHGHPDSLNLGMISHGVDLLPDIGYPDFATRDYAKRADWTSNTISHNTVLVDGRRQQPIWGGRTRVYKRFPELGLMEFDSPCYATASLYRRTVALVRKPNGGAYCWDVFRVQGGREHLQSWHGPEGDLEWLGASTQPGSGVRFGEAEPYLTNPRRLTPSPNRPLTLRYLSHPRWRNDSQRVSLALTVLGTEPTEATLATNRKPSVRTRAESLEYLFLNSPVTSRPTVFSTLLDPHAMSVEPLQVEQKGEDPRSGSTAIHIDLGDGWSDTLVSCETSDVVFEWEPGHRLQGGFSWIRRRAGKLHAARLVGGALLGIPEGTVTTQARFTGEIASLDTDRRGHLWCTCNPAGEFPVELCGEVVSLGHHPERDTAFEIYGIRGHRLNLGPDTVTTGYANARSYSEGPARLCEPGHAYSISGHARLDGVSGRAEGLGKAHFRP